MLLDLNSFFEDNLISVAIFQNQIQFAESEGKSKYSPSVVKLNCQVGVFQVLSGIPAHDSHQANVPFPYPLKTTENQRFFCFQGV